MKLATLCLLINKETDEMLLGLKKKGFGTGKYNGFGGKVEPGESIQNAAIRELYEESGVKVSHDNIRKLGELLFFFPHSKDKSWDHHVHVFVSNKWEGEAVESDEMVPKWFKIKELPFENMWADDEHWFPFVFEDKKFKAKFIFDKDNEKIAEMEINEI